MLRGVQETRGVDEMRCARAGFVPSPLEKLVEVEQRAVGASVLEIETDGDGLRASVLGLAPNYIELSEIETERYHLIPERPLL